MNKINDKIIHTLFINKLSVFIFNQDINIPCINKSGDKKVIKIL